MPTSNGTSPSCWQIDNQRVLSDLTAIALEAGEMITAAATQPPSALSTKKNSADLVTETDQAVEQMISKKLKAKYPTFHFLGEETYQPGMRLGDAPTFVVDPIDGTTNFVHGWEYVSVSLGFACARQPRVGVVFNPFTGIMYTGVRGEGSYVIDTRSADRAKRRLPLRDPAPLTGLSGSLVAIEWGSDREGASWETKLRTFANLGKSKEQGGAMVHSARALGSAALNLCAVARGEIDIYWEGGCWAWDVCAGWVILKEAGGLIVDGNPGGWEIPVDHRKYLAVRGAESGQKEIVEEFWSHVDGTMEYES